MSPNHPNRRFARRPLFGGLVAIGSAGLAAQPATAAEEWCDVDPMLLVTTPDGQRVPVFYVTGALGLAHAATTQLARVEYQATRARGGTRVEISVTVPDDAFGSRFPTRLVVSSGPMGTLSVYGRASGVSGHPMRVRLFLPVT